MWQPQSLYSEFVLRTPVILNGEESIRGLYNYPAERIAVIHGRSFKDFDLFKNTFKKKEIIFIERSWKGEPDLDGLKESLSKIEEFRPDCFIAIGGGSIIDGAKISRLLYELPYYSMGNRIDGTLLKTSFIAIPTTIGSGAEVSSAAVYIEGDHKQMLVSHELQPDVVIYDKRYVENTPKKQLLLSVLDAMSHIIEGYVSNVSNNITDIMAEEGLRLIKEEISSFINNKKTDFTRLQYAGYIGGIVQNHCIVGAAHGIGHQLSKYGYSHGEAVGLLLSAVIRSNMNNADTKNRYDVLSEKAGFNDVNDLLGFIDLICKEAEIDDHKEELKQLLISNENNEEFMNNIRNDKGGKGNPVEMDDEYLKGLFRSI